MPTFLSFSVATLSLENSAEIATANEKRGHSIAKIKDVPRALVTLETKKLKNQIESQLSLSSLHLKESYLQTLIPSKAITRFRQVELDGINFRSRFHTMRVYY